jgi:hypothetical protein
MEKQFLFRVVFIFLVLVTVGCAPTDAQIQRAIAQTQTAAPLPPPLTVTPYPTATQYPTVAPYSTFTPVPTESPVPSATPRYRPITWAQLMDLTFNDHTNWNTWTKQYNCVNFSMDLVSNMEALNVEVWIVAVDFKDQKEGHAFVAFPTTDRGIIWIEPQSDDAYSVSEIDSYLCFANDPYKCWKDGKITRIIEPATCDPITHECW